MADSYPPLVCVFGNRESHNTTVAISLCAALVRRGYRVMALKHNPNAKTDAPGTDSWRLHHEGGAERVVVGGPDAFSMVGRWRAGEEGPEVLADRYLPDAEIIIAEGYSASRLPRIEIFHRGEGERPLYDPARDAEAAGLYLAIVTDDPSFKAAVPVLDAHETDLAEKLAELVIGTLLRRPSE